MCEFLAGWISGGLGLSVGYPMDTIKVNQQILGLGVMSTIRRIKETSGLPGFFRGFTIPLITSAAGNSVFFGLYNIALLEIWKARLKIENADRERRGEALLGSWDSMHSMSLSPVAYCIDCGIAGTIAGGSLLLIVGGPADMIKVNLQLVRGGNGKTSSQSQPQYSGPVDCAKGIYRSRGIPGFYVGIVPMMIRTGLGSGIYMASYEWLQQSLPGDDKVSKSFWAGGTAGLISWWSVLPFDVIKSRLQTQDPKQPLYSGMIDCGRKIYGQLGYQGLYRGFGAVTIRAFPVNAVIFLTYEYVSNTKFCRRVFTQLFFWS